MCEGSKTPKNLLKSNKTFNFLSFSVAVGLVLKTLHAWREPYKSKIFYFLIFASVSCHSWNLFIL